jgi:branched-chain amino acid transport system ATP-binding protein
VTDRGIKKEFQFFFTEGLSRSFGGVQAVDNFSMSLSAGEIVGLIGPNGAGKTTIFNLITGLDRPDTGEVFFQHQYVTHMPAHKIVNLGISRTFQNTRLLGHLSALDNVKIAYHSQIHYTLAHAALRLPKFYAVEKDIAEKSMQFLEFMGIADVAQMKAAALPYGKRRKLELARALATEASLLLLDEPAAGLNPRETEELAASIRMIRDDFKVTILLIEHDMRMVMNLCERIVVVNFGELIAVGTPSELRNNPLVVEAYLGKPRITVGGDAC